MKTWIIILTALAALVGPLLAFAFAGSPVMTRAVLRWYFLPFRFERWRAGRCYRWLGVRQFKYWLPWSGDWIVRRSGKHPLWQGKRQAMLDVAFQNTILYELIHLSILVPLLPLTIMPFQLGAWTAGLFGVAVNVVVNIYPIMVQRFNRARLLPLVSSGVKQRWRIPPG